MKKIAFAILAVLCLTRCNKEEDEKLPGRFISDFIGQANLVSTQNIDYQMQLYYDLSSNQLKAQNTRDAWDLALGCDPQNPNVFVNPAMLMAVAATGNTDFTAAYDPAQYKFKYERAGRYYHSGLMATDIRADGTPGGEVFIIDLGRDLNNQKRGYKLLQLQSIDAGKYVLKTANLDHSEQKTITVETDQQFNYVFLNFSSGEVLKLEPPKEEWDLFFGKYMERLYDGSDTVDYSVTGCLLNPWLTEACEHRESEKDSTLTYNQLRLEHLNRDSLTQRSNVIGHDWKYFDLDAGSYSLIRNKNYFVKDSEGLHYRLHFTGFYDENGRKGAINFEYLPL